MALFAKKTWLRKSHVLFPLRIMGFPQELETMRFNFETKRCKSVSLSAKRSVSTLVGLAYGVVCVECLIGKQKKPILFKVTEPSSIPYRTHPACAKRAAYPDPPPVIPLPESIAAQAVYQLRYKSTEYCSWVSSGPKCFQVLGLSPSLLPNPML
jgi:hypothetical protein